MAVAHVSSDTLTEIPYTTLLDATQGASASDITTCPRWDSNPHLERF